MNKLFVGIAVLVFALTSQAADREQTFTKVPLAFEPNQGQTESPTRFLAHGAGYSVKLEASRAVLDFDSREVTMDLLDASKSPKIAGEARLPGMANYFRSSDPKNWFTGIPTYSKVSYKDVYPGVGLAFYGKNDRLEYDFLLDPGADDRQIRFQLSGAESVRIDGNGDLILDVGQREFRMLKPVAWQPAIGGKGRETVAAGYMLLTAGKRQTVEVSFSLGKYDAKRALVIDPVLSFVYSAYVGYGVAAVAVDSSGDTYVTGESSSAGYYVTKFNTTGTVLYTSTFSGATAWPYGLALDSTGRAYVAGEAYTGLPTTSNAYQPSDPGTYNTFFSVISADGSTLAYATYLAGTAGGYSWANSVAVDSSGKAYLGGYTESSSFPTTTGAYQTAFPGDFTGYVAKIDPSQSGTASLVYSTFLGPNGSNVYAIALDSSGDVYVTGNFPNGYPITAGAFSYSGADSGYGGVYVTELNPTASALVYSAYLGYGTGTGIVVDGQGSAYVTGTVAYADFPTTSGAYQTTYAGGFVVKLPPGAATETYSTFLGGPSSYTGSNVSPGGIAIPAGCASACNAYVSGQTTTTDYPLINAFQAFPSSSGSSGFVTELSGTGNSAAFSSYLSGATTSTYVPNTNNSFGSAPALAVDTSGNISIIEDVSGSDFPITLPGTGTYGVLAKIGPATAGFTWATPSSLTFNNQPVGVSTSITGGTQSINLRNLSNTAVTLTSIVPSPSIFSESDNCNGTIAASGYCTLSIDFTPGSSGQRSGTLTVTSNASNSPAVFALSGTGTDEQYIYTATASLTFGDQSVGTMSTTQSLTVTNLGDESYGLGMYTTANFQELNNCPTQIAPGMSCTATISFIPTSPGLITGYLEIYGYGAVSLSGTGTVSGNVTDLVPSSTSLNFGIQTIGVASPYQTIYISNISSAPVTIQSITASGDYSLNYSSCSLPGQLAPQAYCYARVQFTPTATGTRTGTLTINNSSPTGALTVSLTGTGQASTENVEFYPGTEVSFPDQPVGYPSTYQDVYIYNTGTGTVTIDRVETTGDFQLSYSTCEATTLSGVTPGPRFSYCYVRVTFTPTALGARTGTLTILDSAPNSPQILNLAGKGITATGIIAATPLEINYPAQAVGVTSPNQYVYLTNPGNTPVNVTGQTASGNYAIVYSTCSAPYTLNPGSTCTLYVGFTPTGTTNPRTGAITITSSAGNQTVALSGTGEAATQAIGLTPTALNFGSQVVSQSSGTYYVYARDTGTETVTFTATPTITGANASDFSVYPGSCNNGYTVSSASSCYMYVTFIPGAAGARSATLTLTDSAGTQTLALSGTGVASNPTYTLSSYVVPFNLEVQGTTSSLSNYVYFYNNGPSSVTLGNLAVTGNFLIPNGYQNCNGQVIASGGNCYAYVEFAPASAGYLTGTLAFKNSSGTTLASAALAGYSLAPVYTAYIDPGALSYGIQVINTTSGYQTIYLYNTGNTSLTVGTATGTNVIIGASTTGEFSAGGGNDACSGATVGAGSACAVYLSFTPSETGAQTGSITLPVTYANNSMGNFTATLSGSGLAVTDSAVLSSTAETFLDQTVGTTSSSQTLTLTNSGDRPLTVGTLTGVNTTIGSSTTGEFAAQTDNCSVSTIPAGGTCSIYLTFTPAASGAQSGSVSFPITFVDGSTTTLTSTLSGSGIAATNSVEVSPGGIQFGNWISGTVSGYNTVQLTDTGNVPVQVTTDTVTGAFAIYSDGCAGVTIQPGSYCYVYVTFNPTTTGNASGTLTIGDNGAGGPHTVALAGIGVPASQTILTSQTAVAFGNQPVGSSGSQTAIYLSNQSDSTVSLTSIALAGTNAADFQLNTYTCSSSIAAYGSCYFYVTFAPLATDSGALTATVTVTYGASGSPQTVTLTGTSVAPGPAVALTPSSFKFASTNVGSKAGYQLFSITNTGSANLTNIAVASTNKAEFPIVYDGCSGATLTPQQQCVFAVNFAPSLGGSRTGSITVTDNAAGSPQTITLTGTGVGIPLATLAPSSLAFGSENIGVTSAAKNISVTNTGTDVLTIKGIALSAGTTADFAEKNNCPATLAPNGTCTISVTFTPLVSGSLGASVTVTDNSNNAPGSAQNVAVSGTGVSVSTATASPSALTFASQNINTSSAAQTVTLTNSGSGALSIASVVISGTNASSFSEVSGCGISLPAGANCTIAVTFTPTAVGSLTATLTITDNANNTNGSTQTVGLSGTGVAVPLASAAPASLTFASQNIGTTGAAQNVTLTNSGTGPLTIASVALSGTNQGDFGSVSGCGATLAAGLNCTIAVTFTPTAAGSRAATLTITDNANNTAGSTQTVALSGAGVAIPQAGVAPGSLTFAAQSIGTSSAQQNITLSNGGTGPLTITGIALSSGNIGDFSSTNNCAGSLAANSSCTIAVTFTPTTSGSRGASITITDNANNVSGSTQVVSLTGTGVAVPLASAAPSSLTFANQVVSTTSAAQNVTLMNAGSGPLSIASIAISGTNASSFGETNGCGISLPAGTSCTIAVTFDPTTNTSLSATLTITDNANNVSGATQTVALSGTGILAPVVTSVSVTPSSGTGTTQTFGFEYSDTDGSADLGTVYALFNTTTSIAKACYVYYVQSSNLLYLENAAGSGAAGSVAPGSTATVSNGYCEITGTGSSFTASGNNLTVNVNITFKSTFTGAKTIYMNAVSNEGETSGGLKAKGTWTP